MRGLERTVGEHWLTTLTAIRRGEPDWTAILAYEAPLRRYLARRFPGLGAAERDDLVQEALVAMRERLVPGFDPGRGRFRSLLVTAVANRARDLLRRARPGALEHEPAGPALDAGAGEGDEDAVDLEALIVGAVRGVHDDALARDPPDLELVWVLSGVLVHGRSGAEVARREGLSIDQVKRRLGAVRAEVLRRCLAACLPPDAGPARVARAAALAGGALRDPRAGSRALEDEPDDLVREAARGFVARLRAARTLLGRDGDAGTLDLLRGLAAVLDGGP